MAKKVSGIIKLQVAAGAANPSPPVGPALGQHGVNIMEFCKAFNAKTESLEKGAPVPVEITVYEDRSFTLKLRLLLRLTCLRKQRASRVVLAVLTLKKWVKLLALSWKRLLKLKSQTLLQLI